MDGDSVNEGWEGRLVAAKRNEKVFVIFVQKTTGDITRTITIAAAAAAAAGEGGGAACGNPATVREREIYY
jgi:hypothetical protein